MRGQIQAIHQQTQLVDTPVGFRMAPLKRGVAQRASIPASIQAMLPRIFMVNETLWQWVFAAVIERAHAAIVTGSRGTVKSNLNGGVLQRRLDTGKMKGRPSRQTPYDSNGCECGPLTRGERVTMFRILPAVGG